MSTSHRPHAARSAVVALALLVGLSSCVAGEEVSAAPDVAEHQDVITVQRGALESIAVVSGSVVPSPEFVIPAPRTGEVVFDASASEARAADAPVAGVGGETVVLGQQASIVDLLVSEGEYVAANTPIARARYAGFGIFVSVPPEQLYRMYEMPIVAKASIASGPSGVPCVLVPVPQAAGGPVVSGEQREGADTVQVICLLPVDASVVPGLSARVGLPTGKVLDALLLPVSAVSGDTQRGRVSKLEDDGRISVIDVELGINDGVNIEVVSGLAVGDRVMPNAPGLDQ